MLSAAQEGIFPLGLGIIRVVLKVILHQHSSPLKIGQVFIGYDLIVGQRLAHSIILYRKACLKGCKGLPW